MWLLCARSYNLEFFINDDVAPPYAILSHTWGEEEVTFQDMRDTRHPDQVRRKAGFTKIEYTCAQAILDGLDYAWVDTCCIDKSSSAELSEAINSMFTWYQRADRCYVYMVDVPRDCINLSDDLDPTDVLRGVKSTSSTDGLVARTPSTKRLELFRRSRWFIRGWTLQELIAPFYVEFRNQDWGLIGALPNLVLTVGDVTGIDHMVLTHDRGLDECCLAEKLSWASERLTSRVEDIAYCLLGICGVNMPLLYGERSNAFKRLQEELLRTSNDQSLLAWNGTTPRMSISYRVLVSRPSQLRQRLLNELRSSLLTSTQVLASSPAAFRDCGPVRASTSSTAQFSIDWSKHGVKARLPLQHIGNGYYVALLGCTYGAQIPRLWELGVAVGLLLTHKSKAGAESARHLGVTAYRPSQLWGRLTFFVDELLVDTSLSAQEEILILWSDNVDDSKLGAHGASPRNELRVRLQHITVRLSSKFDLEFIDGYPRTAWNLKAALGFLDLRNRFAALTIEFSGSERIVLILFLEPIQRAPHAPLLRFMRHDSWLDVLAGFRLQDSPLSGIDARQKPNDDSTSYRRLVSLLGIENDRFLTYPDSRIMRDPTAQTSVHGFGTISATPVVKWSTSISIEIHCTLANTQPR